MEKIIHIFNKIRNFAPANRSLIKSYLSLIKSLRNSLNIFGSYPTVSPYRFFRIILFALSTAAVSNEAR